ncbi:MAG: hypothetical protein DMG11_12655, partial [Acidobacteria bacterium]
MLQYVDAMELYWNSYIIIYDSGAQLQLFHSAQERVQNIQTDLRNKSDRWVARGQMLSDRFAKMSRELFETIWFWSVVAAIFIGYGA